jgi:glycosyltransferase involved in cell wall biosynthesis
MASEPPLLSAIICVRDGERYLGEAIESVLGQTHPRVEVIVVDNGSTDSSVALARRYGDAVRIVDEPRAGIPYARNAGLSHAAGQLIAFLDYDDLWLPAKTEVQLAALEADPGVAIALGLVQQWVSPEIETDVAALWRVPSEPQRGLNLGAALARREVWERVGPWPVGIELSDGLHWFLRARSLGLRELMLPSIVMRRRVHGQNHSLLSRHERAEYARVLKGSIDARRRGSAPPSS